MTDLLTVTKQSDVRHVLMSTTIVVTDHARQRALERGDMTSSIQSALALEGERTGCQVRAQAVGYRIGDLVALCVEQQGLDGRLIGLLVVSVWTVDMFEHHRDRHPAPPLLVRPETLLGRRAS